MAAAADIYGVTQISGLEHGAYIAKNYDGTYSYSPPVQGTDSNVEIEVVGPIPQGTKSWVGTIHTHTDYGTYPSQTD